MKEFRFGKTSRGKFAGVDPRLVACMYRGLYLSPHDFGISCGLRTIEQQRVEVEKGASETMHSRHLTGHAVDIVIVVDGMADWTFEKYAAVNRSIQDAAREFGVEITWGGNWKSRDGVHFEIKR